MYDNLEIHIRNANINAPIKNHPSMQRNKYIFQCDSRTHYKKLIYHTLNLENSIFNIVLLRQFSNTHRINSRSLLSFHPARLIFAQTDMICIFLRMTDDFTNAPVRNIYNYEAFMVPKAGWSFRANFMIHQ